MYILYTYYIYIFFVGAHVQPSLLNERGLPGSLGMVGRLHHGPLVPTWDMRSCANWPENHLVVFYSFRRTFIIIKIIKCIPHDVVFHQPKHFIFVCCVITTALTFVKPSANIVVHITMLRWSNANNLKVRVHCWKHHTQRHEHRVLNTRQTLSQNDYGLYTYYIHNIYIIYAWYWWCLVRTSGVKVVGRRSWDSVGRRASLGRWGGRRASLGLGGAGVGL